ncbi:MAG: acetyl-CoA decarbonylase/synthase complex subunit delta [Bacillota bacterium]|nr:acetyl-CoA decarbonylase/synthase complex subunit delta [Bacillota bacterium]
MPVGIQKERYSSKVGTVTLGALPESGGTRTRTVTVGGDSTMPFLHFEGEMPNRAAVAFEVPDIAPPWDESLKRFWGDVWGDPAAWARKAVEEHGADLICLKLLSPDPDLGGTGPEQCAEVTRAVLGAVGVPLIVIGCGIADIDNVVMPAVAEAGAGENLLLGTATQDNYKTLTAACMVHKHNIVALSPIDINICKQLNILINEMNLPLERIIIDPTVGALGYGIEYTYSIMERIRLGTLQGDRMLSMPVICNIGYEAWRAKETKAPAEDFPGWGDAIERGTLWEAMTATLFLQAGGHIFVMRNPEAVGLLRGHIDQLMVSNR